MWKSFYFSHSDADVSSCSVEKTETCNFIKNETLAQVFSCDIAKFLRTLFLQQTSGGCVLPYLCRLIAQNTFLKPVPLISCMKKKLIAFVGFLIKLPWNISIGGNVFLEMFFYQRKKCTRKWTLNIKFKKMVSEALSIL